MAPRRHQPGNLETGAIGKVYFVYAPFRVSARYPMHELDSDMEMTIRHALTAVVVDREITNIQDAVDRRIAGVR